MVQGKTIAVGGGTGDVGFGIVAALTEAGAKVIVPARSAQKAKALKDALEHPERLRVVAPDDLAGIGAIDAAIASLGSWFSFGPLVQTTPNEFETAFDSLLKSHFTFARAVVPQIRKGGSYITINGAGSEAPVPNASAVSIMAHGLSMLTEALKAEHPALHVHTLMLRSIIATRARARHDPAWVTAHEVGQAAAWLLTPTGRLAAGSTLSLNPKVPVPATE